MMVVLLSIFMITNDATAQRVVASVNIPGVSIGINTGPGYYGYRDRGYYAPRRHRMRYVPRHYGYMADRRAMHPNRGRHGYYKRQRVYRVPGGCF